MISFFFRRLIHAVPVLMGVITIVFFFIHMIPGDPVDIMLGESAQLAQRQELRAKLHLDDPLPVQYFAYLGGLLHGDLGHSILSGEAVIQKISRTYPATLLLSLAALIVAISIAIPAGVIAAARKDTWWDTGMMTAALAGLSMPAFWLGPILILIFAYDLGWFPISGKDEALAIVLPALTLGTGMAALLSRMTRATVLDVAQEDFVRTARAKGLSARVVWFKHVLRNALLPIITVLGLQAGALLAGSVITEKVFSWPGLGLEMVEAIERRDYPVVQGCVLLVSITYVLINVGTDFLYAWIDPRIHHEKHSS